MFLNKANNPKIIKTQGNAINENWGGEKKYPPNSISVKNSSTPNIIKYRGIIKLRL